MFRRLILPLYAPSLLYAFAYAMFIPTLPLFAGELTNSYAMVGLLLAAESFGKLGGDLPAGALLGRLGIRNTSLLGLGVSSAAWVSMFWVPNALVALVLMFIAGMGAAVYNIARHSYIAGVSVQQRGRSIAMFGGVFRVGKLAGPIAGGFIAGALGLRAPFLTFGVLGVIAIVFVVLYMPANDGGASGKHTRIGDTLRQHWPVLSTAGVGQILVQLTRQGFLTVMPLYAADVVGLDVRTIGIVMGVGAAVDALFFYPAGMIMDGMGRKWAIVPPFVLQATGLALIPLMSNAVGLATVAALIGLANGLSSGTMMTVGSDLAPPDARGSFLGVWRLIGDVGFGGGPMVVGGVANLFALPVAALAVSGAGVAGALVFAFLVPETLREPSWQLIKTRSR